MAPAASLQAAARSLRAVATRWTLPSACGGARPRSCLSWRQRLPIRYGAPARSGRLATVLSPAARHQCSWQRQPSQLGAFAVLDPLRWHAQHSAAHAAQPLAAASRQPHVVEPLTCRRWHPAAVHMLVFSCCPWLLCPPPPCRTLRWRCRRPGCSACRSASLRARPALSSCRSRRAC